MLDVIEGGQEMPRNGMGSMDKEYRQLIYMCFSCGYKVRKWQLIYNNTIPVSFKKCPKCGKCRFAFYRRLPKGRI